LKIQADVVDIKHNPHRATTYEPFSMQTLDPAEQLSIILLNTWLELAL